MTIQHFLEEYLPDYYRSDTVARWLDLDMQLSGESETTEGRTQLFIEFSALTDTLFSQALKHYSTDKLDLLDRLGV